MAKKNKPRKGGYYSSEIKYLAEFEINMSKESMKKMPETSFKTLGGKASYTNTSCIISQTETKQM